MTTRKRTRSAAAEEPVAQRNTATVDNSALDSVMADINKRDGDNTAMTGSQIPGFNSIETGVFTLDYGLLGGIPEGLVSTLYGWEGTGKALSLDTPIPTPDGWTTMGELSVGDTVFSDTGKPCNVTYATGVQHNKECFEVCFSDGEVITACADHLWEVHSRYADHEVSPRILNTADLAKDVYRDYGPSDRRYRWRVRLSGPVEYASKSLPVDPYALGVWLGDGHSDSSRLTTVDEGVLENLRDVGVVVERRKAGDRAPLYQMSTDYGLQATLRSMEVLGNKHIPETYLQGAVEQRLSLLQGLMDTDGYVSKAGWCEFVTIKRTLADEVYELAASLGQKVTIKESRATLNGKDCGPRFRVCFTVRGLNPFRLNRKAEVAQTSLDREGRTRGFRTIVDVRPVNSVPVRCITVDSDSHLYLAGRAMVITHNTTLAMRILAAAQRKYPDEKPVWVDAEGTYDPVWAESHGAQADRMYYLHPDSGEKAVDYVSAVMRTAATPLIVIDSIPALVPQKTIDASAEDSQVAMQARLVSRMCSTVLAGQQASKKKGKLITVIFINQFRSKIGVIHGDPRTLPGGNQARYLSSVSIEVKKKKEHYGKDFNDMEYATHNEHAFAIKKSKIGNSLNQAEFVINRTDEHPYINAGDIDDALTVLTYAKRMGWWTGGGTSWRLEGVDGTFAKREAAIEWLYANPEEFVKLKRRLISYRREQSRLPAIPNDGYLLGYV